MAVETALYPPQLNTAWPQASDMVSEGDNHIRLTKTVIKTTFPNVAGVVSATDVQLSYVTGVTSAIQAQIDSKGAIAGQTWTGTHVFPSTTTIGGLTPTIRGYLETVTSDAQAQINARAIKAGDTYTGAHSFTGATITVPTATAGDATTNAASTAFVASTAFAAALPGQSGNAGKYVTTNGSAASWASVTGPVTLVSSPVTATASNHYVFTASTTLTLPPSPGASDWVRFSNRSGTSTPTIARNGQNIMGLPENLTIDSVDASGLLVFVDATRGWVLA